jgi:Ca2+-binding RTX toxin-like protein
VGGFGNDMMYGLGGDDRLDGQAGNDVLDGGDGNDNLVGNFGNDKLLGGAGSDNLSDDQGSNVLDGGAGDDYLNGQSIDDQILLGGEGNDWLSGGVGSVSMDGGAGNDNLNIQTSRHVVALGGAGDDNLDAYQQFWVQALPDVSWDGSAITLDGGDGNDTVKMRGAGLSGYGNERGAQTIALIGGAGNDSLDLSSTAYLDPNYGPYGVASLDGGEGNDVLSGSSVRQLSMTGGSGADTFVLTVRQYNTIKAGTTSILNMDGSVDVRQVDAVVITDFAGGLGNDVLDYSDMVRNGARNFDGSNPFATGHLKLVQSGADTLVQFKEDGAEGTAVAVTVAVLQNVDKGSLVAANFNPNYPPDGSSGENQVIVGG